MQKRSRFLRDFMPEQHRAFFGELEFVILSAVDKQGFPWPFLRTGVPGFISSDDPKRLMITSSALPIEAADLRLDIGDKISVLGIQFETRRRNRMNGTIVVKSGESLTIDVDQSFGNCARYIHVREVAHPVQPESEVVDTRALTPQMARQIISADMFFIASRSEVLGEARNSGIDVNHRGGQPGFVKLEDNGELLFPDYDGNNFFNSLGNIMLDSRVALMFPDFSTGDVITLAGHAEVIMDKGVLASKYGGTRVVKVKPHAFRYAPCVLPIKYKLSERSDDSPSPDSL